MDQFKQGFSKVAGRIRKRRGWWQRRRFWITLLAILGAIVTTLWLIHSIGNYQDPD